MSEFKVEVMKVDEVFDHSNADRLSIVKIRGYNCIANKHEDGSPRYVAGDLVVYIPEGSVLPEEILQKMGFWKDGKGTLAGPLGNRVKAIRLRGVVSQGILYPVVKNRIEDTCGRNGFVLEGDDVAEYLEIKKYEPVIPTSMNGEVVYVGRENTIHFDVENIQKYPIVFKDDELVSITEKLHGTFCGLAFNPNLGSEKRIEVFCGEFYAFSKGLGADGLVFKANDANAGNLYQKTLVQNIENFRGFVHRNFRPDLMHSIYVLGEVYGKGVQDLTYGEDKPEFRVFAVYVRFLSDPSFAARVTVENVDDFFKTVPNLYVGPFSMEKVIELRDGKTRLGEGHIREGVVVVPVQPRYSEELGGVAMIKAVSPDYLLRKGENVTEFN